MSFTVTGFKTITSREPGVSARAVSAAIGYLKTIAAEPLFELPDLDWTLINSDLHDRVAPAACTLCGEVVPYFHYAGPDGFEIHVSEAELTADFASFVRAIYHAIAHVALIHMGRARSVAVDQVRDAQAAYNADPGRETTRDTLVVDARTVNVLKLVLP